MSFAAASRSRWTSAGERAAASAALRELDGRSRIVRAGAQQHLVAEERPTAASLRAIVVGARPSARSCAMAAARRPCSRPRASVRARRPGGRGRAGTPRRCGAQAARLLGRESPRRPDPVSSRALTSSRRARRLLEYARGAQARRRARLRPGGRIPLCGRTGRAPRGVAGWCETSSTGLSRRFSRGSLRTSRRLVAFCREGSRCAGRRVDVVPESPRRLAGFRVTGQTGLTERLRAGPHDLAANELEIVQLLAPQTGREPFAASSTSRLGHRRRELRCAPPPPRRRRRRASA